MMKNLGSLLRCRCTSALRRSLATLNRSYLTLRRLLVRLRHLLKTALTWVSAHKEWIILFASLAEPVLSRVIDVAC